ncbi:MAG: biotin-dependent carboxyltransferase family protein [Bryobacteraceae bacterium]
MFTTVQDLGRPGHGIQGVSRAGAADSLALRIGNRILGNDDNAPALEMTLLGGTFSFPEGAQIALTGGRPATLPAYRIIDVQPGESIRVGELETGARCYLCIRGGIDASLVAGSASTHVLSGLGGRPLRKGDLINIGNPTNEPMNKPIPPELTTYRKLLRVTKGPQASQFPEDTFYCNEFTVSPDSNRMGIRLEGPPIASPQHGQMITEGVPLGAIQIPANGQPIILFVDQQTTGGYPKIANIVTADLPSTGQLRPRDRVRFQLVSNAEAQQLLRQQEALLSQL